ncbi:hypothetical protein ACO0LO_05765 [Undibacterium sp. TJN25]|uniref:hypothetical protein n=1 Tax=Undibacterium sp. TJN25 TaxID=3413056 RepID=UPI003BF1E2E6
MNILSQMGSKYTPAYGKPHGLLVLRQTFLDSDYIGIGAHAFSPAQPESTSKPVAKRVIRFKNVKEIPHHLLH